MDADGGEEPTLTLASHQFQGIGASFLVGTDDQYPFHFSPGSPRKDFRNVRGELPHRQVAMGIDKSRQERTSW